MAEAHQIIGLKNTATMVFGHVETPEERVLHLVRVREQQDRTGGFTAFIPWSFQPGNTMLGGDTATGVDYLKTLTLAFGANDFGSAMLEENVVRAAGVNNRVPVEEIVHCIQAVGYTAAQRNTGY